MSSVFISFVMHYVRVVSKIRVTSESSFG